MDFKFNLGQRAKDVVTGFSGVIMSRIQYMTGCNQYGICPTKLDKEGKTIEWNYYDENRIVLAGKALKLPKAKGEKEVKGADGPLPASRA